MDIDCELFGSVEPMVPFNGDVSLYVGVKFHRRGMSVVPSSRVIVWQPTAAARRPRDNWEQLCREQNLKAPKKKDDEKLLMQAISLTSGLSINIIDLRYSGRDPKDAPRNAVVIHHSAHNEARIATEPMSYLKQVRRSLIAKIVGKSYFEWKYGAVPASSDEPLQ